MKYAPVVLSAFYSVSYYYYPKFIGEEAEI